MKAERSQQDMIALFRHLALHRPAGRKVRVGRRGDGGYVLLDDFQAVSSMVSIGIGGEASFDQFFLDRGIAVHQFDGTITASPSDARADFHRLNLGAADSSGTVSLRTIMARCVGAGAEAILKFDIEGAEWDAFASVTPRDLQDCRQIVCELHDLPGIQFKPGFYDVALHALRCLTANHAVIHFHVNNSCEVSLRAGIVIPGLCELTLLRRDIVPLTKLPAEYPDPLDWPSHATRDEIYLDAFRF